MKCYVCDSELNANNRSEEHIIINAAGGRLKSKNLICKQCNSDFGTKVDAALAKQLNFISNQLMISRERGEPQPVVGKQEASGQEIRILSDGTLQPNKPEYHEIREGDKVQISFSVRDDDELKSKAKEIAHKHPQLKEDDIIAAATHKEGYLEEPLTFSLECGGPEVFRAICKCAVNYFVHLEGDISFIRPLLCYIKGEEEKDVVWFHYKEGVYDLKYEECFHMIHLRGNPDEKVLYCYVDYFNVYKYLVLLSDVYEGVEITSTYCFDVLNSMKVEKMFLADYDRGTAMRFFNDKDSPPFDKLKKAFEHTMAISQSRQQKKHIEKISTQAWNNSMGKYPGGTIITEDMVNKLIDETMKGLEPLLGHLMGDKK